MVSKAFPKNFERKTIPNKEAFQILTLVSVCIYKLSEDYVLILFLTFTAKHFFFKIRDPWEPALIKIVIIVNFLITVYDKPLLLKSAY